MKIIDEIKTQNNKNNNNNNKNKDSKEQGATEAIVKG